MILRIPPLGTCFEEYQIEISYLLGRPKGMAQQAKPPSRPCTPDVSATRSKIMKTFRYIVCAATLALTVSATTLAKTGTISTTRTGTISTTASGTISTTRTGTISTTRTGIISTTAIAPRVNSTGYWLFELLLTVGGLR